jgi:hypothetical protein
MFLPPPVAINIPVAIVLLVGLAYAMSRTALLTSRVASSRRHGRPSAVDPPPTPRQLPRSVRCGRPAVAAQPSSPTNGARSHARAVWKYRPCLWRGGT